MCLADAELEEAGLVHSFAAQLRTATESIAKLASALRIAGRKGRPRPTVTRESTYADLPTALLDSVGPAELLVRSLVDIAQLHSSSWGVYQADCWHLLTVLKEGNGACKSVLSRLAGTSSPSGGD